MRVNLKQCIWVLAVALGTGITAGTVRAAASPSSQEQPHDQDYSKNKMYQQGLREGRDDRAHNKDHSKKRHFKKDEDQKAYEAGYQQGHQGDQHDH
jgi:ribosome modulation factor